MTSCIDIMTSCIEIIIFFIKYHYFFIGYHKKKRAFLSLKNFRKFFNDENTSTKIMISCKKIMTSYAVSHNFNTECHNISMGCHNFFRRKRAFSSFKISTEKVKVWTLNARWKMMTMWPNRTRWCTPRLILYTMGGVRRISPLSKPIDEFPNTN